VRAYALVLAVAALGACHCYGAFLGLPVHTLVSIGGTQCTSWPPIAHWRMLKKTMLIEHLGVCQNARMLTHRCGNFVGSRLTARLDKALPRGAALRRTFSSSSSSHSSSFSLSTPTSTGILEVCISCQRQSLRGRQEDVSRVGTRSNEVLHHLFR
jgi:hypothetical protein